MKSKLYLKYIVILISIFFVTACDVDYKIDIDESLEVTETINFTNKNIDKYAPLMGFSSTEELFDTIYSQAEKEALERGYTIENRSINSKVDVLFTKKSNILLLGNSKFKDLYSYFDTRCSKDKCSITAVPKETTDEGDGIFPNYKISIKVPYEVLKQNADEIDLKNNTYIWYYSLSGEKNNINLIFYKQGENVIAKNKINSSIIISIIAIILVVIFFFIFRLAYKIMKNNRPDF